jgi:hypothetical protein
LKVLRGKLSAGTHLAFLDGGLLPGRVLLQVAYFIVRNGFEGSSPGTAFVNNKKTEKSLASASCGGGRWESRNALT